MQLYRRSWEKKQFGRAGAISNVVSTRSGTDGVIAVGGGTASQASPVPTISSATAAWVSTDVGRVLRLLATPSRRYDGNYIVDYLCDSVALSGGSATHFLKGETVTWAGGSATVVVDQASNTTPLITTAHTGVAATGTITGGTSGATATGGATTANTTVALRWNHNTGCPTSVARFMATGSSITWRLAEGCTFTFDAGGDLAATDAGSYVSIEGDSHAANNGLWRICNYLTNQTCQLAKSYLYYVGDVTTTVDVTADHNADFVVSTGMQWAITDREPINMVDMFMMIRQFYIDTGWSLYQSRGSNAISSSNNNLVDDVFRSVGETDATNLPDGRIMYVRGLCQGYSRSSPGVVSLGIDFVPWLSWDPTQTATLPGNGLAPAPYPADTGNTSSTTATPTATSSGWGESDANVTDIITTGRNGAPIKNVRYDLVLFGDADEVVWLHNLSLTPAQFVGCISSLVQSGNNKFSCALNATTSSGASVAVNTGLYDLSTKGYAVGDRVTVRGLSPTTNVEYLETTTITAFGGSSPNFTTTVANLSRTYGNGTYDTKKGYIGNDPFPIVMASSNNTTWAIRLHNTANAGLSPGKDYDNTNKGTASAGQMVNALALTSLSPNYRSGNYGLTAIEVRYDANNEFRGRFKYLWAGDTRFLTLGKKLLDPVNNQVYIAFQLGAYITTNITAYIGPMSKVLAGVR